jgi:predicted nucleotide-binding protein
MITKLLCKRSLWVLQMLDKIAELKTLRSKIDEFGDPENLDYGLLDKFLRGIRLSIKHCFGSQSEYIADLKEIVKSFPKEPSDSKFNDEDLEYQYVATITTLENLIDTMITDLERSQKESELDEKQNEVKKSVFIVHGQDFQPVKELKAILKKIGIAPIVLYDQPSRGMTIIEKLEQCSEVDFAFVLLTPDDLGLKKQIISEVYKAYHEQENPTDDKLKNWLKTLKGPYAEFIIDRVLPSIENRARQNVVLEFGYFIGRLGRSKVCCLYKGDLELPSDMHGICYLPFNSSVEEVENTILGELRAAKIIAP